MTSTSGLPSDRLHCICETLSAAGVAVVPPQQERSAASALRAYRRSASLVNRPGFAQRQYDGCQRYQVYANEPAVPSSAATSFYCRQTQLREAPAGPDTSDSDPNVGWRILFVQSTLPIYGSNCFSRATFKVLANVAAGPGNTFVPPSLIALTPCRCEPSVDCIASDSLRAARTEATRRR